MNCARRDRLRPRTPHTPGPPSAVVDFSDSRKRAPLPGLPSNSPRTNGSPRRLVTAGNLDILETWLYQRTGTQPADTVFDNTDPGRQHHGRPNHPHRPDGRRHPPQTAEPQEPNTTAASPGTPGLAATRATRRSRTAARPRWTSATIHHPEQARTGP